LTVVLASVTTVEKLPSGEPPERESEPQSFHDWALGSFGTWSAPLSGKQAMVQVLLPCGGGPGHDDLRYPAALRGCRRVGACFALRFSFRSQLLQRPSTAHSGLNNPILVTFRRAGFSLSPCRSQSHSMRERLAIKFSCNLSPDGEALRRFHRNKFSSSAQAANKIHSLECAISVAFVTPHEVF
jgi:hypothetical protein